VGCGDLGDELERAAGSIGRNLAEGCGHYTRPQKVKFYRIALGSAGECACILDQVRVKGAVPADVAAQARAVLVSATALLVGLVR
jgi:four helix bundle protein